MKRRLREGTMFRSFSGILLALLLSTGAAGQTPDGGLRMEGRAVWANPNNVATSDSAVRAFIDHCKRANIQLIVLLTKHTDKTLYYHSRRFPESIAPRFKDFDPLAAVVREAHKAGIRVHAWISSFPAAPDGPIMQKHPEWAMRNPEGNITSEAEYLANGRRYYMNWMCPARRPGYTDQWLLPVIEEIVANYEVDGIHHDYVRYPGDVAPDSYCFCDYCLEAMLKYAHFYYEAFPDTIYDIVPRLPNFVANWWSDPTVKPRGWDTWDRRRKAEFLLKGSFIRGGPSDLDYFFYTFRQEQIKRFVREAWERASAIRPDIEVSAAVFKNPIASGRFIGQRWTDFAPWIDIMMPMVYRSHFPPRSFDTFLIQLEEYTRYEYRWAKDRVHLYMGLDVAYIYNEERDFHIHSRAALDSLKTASRRERKAYLQKLQAEFDAIREHFTSVAPDLAGRYQEALQQLQRGDASAADRMREILTRLRVDPPAGFYPPEKLRRVIETVRKGGSKGIVLFSAVHIQRRKLWPVLEQVFAEPAEPPETAGPAAEMSIVTLKALRQQLARSRQQRNLFFVLTAALVLFLLIRVVRRRLE